MYQENSIFSIFINQERFFKIIVEQLRARECQQQIDFYSNQVQDNVYRKLAIVLSTPTPDNSNEHIRVKEKQVQKEVKTTVCQQSLWFKSQRVRNDLLRICRNCDDFDFSQFLSSVDDFERLIDTTTQSGMVQKVFRSHWSKKLRTLN